MEVTEAVEDEEATEDELSQAWATFDAAAYQENLADHPGLDVYEIIQNLICYVDPAASRVVAREVAEGLGCVAAELTPPISEGWSPAKTQVWREAAEKERDIHQLALLRDIFGNPFRPVTFDPAWRSETSLTIAQGIYAERAFDRLPILADALQDAGCNSDDLLNHLRNPNATHVRGCWALDLVLGKG